jgi:hypothetical protein
MIFNPNTLSAFDDLLNDIIAESNKNLLESNESNKSNESKQSCPRLQKLFYDNKPCLYKSLILFLFLILLESYSFICGGVGYIICLHITNKTQVEGKLLTDNYIINDLLAIHIILCIVSIIYLSALFGYNGI